MKLQIEHLRMFIMPWALFLLAKYVQVRILDFEALNIVILFLLVKMTVTPSI